MALEALKKAEERISCLCGMVNTLAKNPKKVRAEDWNDKIIDAIKYIESSPKELNGDWFEDTLNGQAHKILKCQSCDMLFSGNEARTTCKTCHV